MSQTSIDIPDEQNSFQTSPPQRPQPRMANTEWLYIVAYYVVVFPFIILYSIVCWFFRLHSTSPLSIYGNLNDEVQETAKLWVSNLPYVAIRRRFAILCLAWVVVNLSVRELRSKLLLGSELWKWSILVAQVSCGYHISSQGTKILVHLLCKNNEFTKKMYAKFYAKGARRTVSLVLYSGSVLLTWVLYFRRSWGIKKTPEAEVILHVGTWSFVTLAVGSLLWLFKRVLVLLWEVNAVYSRFRHRILDARSDIYFLAQICAPHVDIWTKIEVGQEQKEAMDKQTNKVGRCTDAKEGEDSDQKKKEREENKHKAKRILFGDKANMYDIKRMAMFFVNFSNASRKDDGTYDVLDKSKIDIPSRDHLTEEDFEIFKLEKDALKKVLARLRKEHRSETISYEKFGKSMEKAHKNCIEIGRTLFDAREVVKVLDRVWTCIVIVIATIAWLLLTDIASTKMLLLIASPFLAATFVFGDTCKKIFEGIIFSFVNHPFDVGDRCIIDNYVALEVKRMSVFSTTFKVFGTTEEVLYPNSELASKPIFRLKGDPKPNDKKKVARSSTF